MSNQKPRGARSARTPLIMLLALVGMLLAAAPASAAVTFSADGNTLAAPLDGASGGVYMGDPAVPPYPAGTADSALAGFPTAGGSFTILTSGDVELADDPNSSCCDGPSLGYEDPLRGDANDPMTLRVDFTVPAANNCVGFDYKFLSEEFPEYVNKGYNDGFVAELDTTNWNSGNQTINAPNDFAADKGDKVSVDTVGPTTVNAANAAGTTYDGATTVLTTKTVVTPGAHSIYLSVFDLGDSVFDAAVFVDNLRFSTEPPSTCHPPDLFGGKTGITALPAGTKIVFKKGSATVPLTCNLQVETKQVCPGTLGLTAGGSKSAATAKKKKKKGGNLAKGSYSIPAGQTQAVPLKLTGAGRKALKKGKKIKASLTVTNTRNSAVEKFPVTVSGKKKKK